MKLLITLSQFDELTRKYPNMTVLEYLDLVKKNKK